MIFRVTVDTFGGWTSAGTRGVQGRKDHDAATVFGDLFEPVKSGIDGLLDEGLVTFSW